MIRSIVLKGIASICGLEGQAVAQELSNHQAH